MTNLVEEVSLEQKSAIEIEQELLKQTEADQLSAFNALSIDQKNDMLFNMIFTAFSEKVNGLMAKDAKKVLLALMGLKYLKINATFDRECPQDVYNLGSQLMLLNYLKFGSEELEMMRNAEEQPISDELKQELDASTASVFEQGNGALEEGKESNG